MSYTAETMYAVPPAPQPTGLAAPNADPAITSMNTKTQTGMWSSASLWIVLLIAAALGLVSFTVRAGR